MTLASASAPNAATGELSEEWSRPARVRVWAM